MMTSSEMKVVVSKAILLVYVSTKEIVVSDYMELVSWL